MKTNIVPRHSNKNTKFCFFVTEKNVFAWQPLYIRKDGCAAIECKKWIFSENEISKSINAVFCFMSLRNYPDNLIHLIIHSIKYRSRIQTVGVGPQENSTLMFLINISGKFSLVVGFESVNHLYVLVQAVGFHSRDILRNCQCCLHFLEMHVCEVEVFGHRILRRQILGPFALLLINAQCNMFKRQENFCDIFIQQTFDEEITIFMTIKLYFHSFK